DGPQLPQEMFEFVVTEQQRVAAAEQHVPDGGCAANVINLLVEARMKIVPAGIAHQARACAITAIRRATVGYQEQHPIGIPMYEARHRRVTFFTARVVQFPGSRMSFLDTR